MRPAWRSGLLLIALPASLALAQQPGMRYQVVIEGMRFQPAQLTVKPGDEVEWVNRDAFPHTATAMATANGKFDTGEIAAGASKRLRIMGKGEIPYICTLHPTMKAQLTVR